VHILGVDEAWFGSTGCGFGCWVRGGGSLVREDEWDGKGRKRQVVVVGEMLALLIPPLSYTHKLPPLGY